MLRNAWLIPLLPALSFVAILLFGKRLPRKGAELGVGAVGASFVLACAAAWQWIDKVEGATGKAEGLAAFGKGMLGGEGGEHAEAVVAPVTRAFTWWQNGNVEFKVGTASMLLLVVADNTVELLVGWELVGLCSFVLIGHWWEEKPNADAAVKAFLTTRVGDVGLMIGIVVLFFAAGTFDIQAINGQALEGEVGHTLLLVASACLLAGIIGKSGQFPLHTWLPDAMAGPTPVSALIHAATMVVAGVYLGARLFPVFFEGFSIDGGTINVMALVGGVTIIIGAVLAFVQRDIKKVLAYSTISQLGYMVMGLGVGAWVAAVFHLFTHAFFKALLFLGAGSVSHSGSHHSFDMKNDMGGLRKFMPVTFWTFLIGSLALAGIFPFAGFWSKDEILATAGENEFTFFVVVGLIGALMTAAYMTRCVYLTFFGEYRGHGEPHESPRAITVPLVVLAGFSVVAGFLNASAFDVEKFKEWVEPTVAFPLLEHPEFELAGALLALTVALLGILIGYAYWFRNLGPHGVTERNRAARVGYTFLENKYYLDALYENVIVGSIKGAIARASYWVNQRVIDGAVNGVAAGAAQVGRFAYDVVDQQGVDAR